LFEWNRSIPGVVQVSADNANTVSTNVVVLDYGCIYQGGYVYAFDDTTPSSASVGGKVVTTINQAPSGGVIWSSNGNSGTTPDAVFDAIYGISELSTTSSPDPNAGQVTGQIACDGALNGLCNTNNIYVYYQNFALNAPINLSFYATGLCKQAISGFSDWYLPAICELGYDNSFAGTGCGNPIPTLQNMQTSLIDLRNPNLIPNGQTWSSTEYSVAPATDALIQGFTNFGGVQGGDGKLDQIRVRCSRLLN
jgi:hypothetical protein